MPKGFNQKAIEGFNQWMTAILGETGMSKEETKNTAEKTTNLLKNGFPQVRKY